MQKRLVPQLSPRILVLGLAVLWIGLVLIVDARGNFPLIDDFSYGRSVQILLEQGRLRYDEWVASTLFLQVFYGTLFCLPFGFSFMALRVSTLVAAFVGGLGTYALLRQASARRSEAVLGSLVLMFNPLYFQHSFTFMTDVPFTTLAVLSAIFFLRALGTGSVRDVAVGAALASCASLIRQLGIAVPIGYAFALLATGGMRRRTFALAVAPVVFTYGVLSLFNAVMERVGATRVPHGGYQEDILTRLADHGPAWVVVEALKTGTWMFVGASWFVLPFALFLLKGTSPWRDLSKTARRLIAFLSTALFVLLLSRNLPPNQPLNVFTLGPMGLLNDSAWSAPGEPLEFRMALVVGALAAATLMAAIVLAIAIGHARNYRLALRSDAAPALLLALATTAVMLGPWLLLGGFMERYLIPIVPFVMLALAAVSRGWKSGTTTAWRAGASAGALVTLITYGLISIAFAHDFLVWNRARWHAVDHLVHEKGIDPARIDGGFPANGWYLFPIEGPVRQRFMNFRSYEGPLPFWQNSAAEYVVLFGQAKREAQDAHDWPVVWSEGFSGWLPGGDGSIVVRHRGEASSLPTTPK